MPGLRQQIQSSLGGRVCFMGLGNVQDGDDGFGVRLAEELERAGVPDVVFGGNRPGAVGRRVAPRQDSTILFFWTRWNWARRPVRWCS